MPVLQAVVADGGSVFCCQPSRLAPSGFRKSVSQDCRWCQDSKFARAVRVATNAKTCGKLPGLGTIKDPGTRTASRRRAFLLQYDRAEASRAVLVQQPCDCQLILSTRGEARSLSSGEHLNFAAKPRLVDWLGKVHTALARNPQVCASL